MLISTLGVGSQALGSLGLCMQPLGCYPQEDLALPQEACSQLI